MTVEKEDAIYDGRDEDRKLNRSKSRYTCISLLICMDLGFGTKSEPISDLLSFDPSVADRLQILRTPLDPHLWLWHDFHLDDSLLFTQAGQDLRLDTLEFRFRAVDLVDVRVLQFTDLSDVRDADWQRAGL